MTPDEARESSSINMPSGLRCVYLCSFPGLGGTQEYTFMLARKMAAHNPTILAMPFDPLQRQHFEAAFHAAGGETVVLPQALCDGLNGRSYAGRLKASLALRRFIQANVPLAPGERLVLHTSLSPVAFAPVALLAGRRSVAVNVFHDFGLLNGRSISFLPNTVALRLLPKRRTGFVVPSAHIADDLTGKVAALPLDRIDIIHNGMDPLPARPPHTPGSPMRFGMIGRVAEAKAPDIWVAAIRKFVDRGGQGSFHWYGQGPLIEGARTETKHLGLKDTAFHGFVDDAAEVLRALDVFVLSSRWEGGCLPYSVMEAMFCGVPCILPKLPSILESLDGKDCAIFYEPDDASSLSDALAEATAEPAALTRMAISARRLVERHHTADMQFAATVKLYARLLGNAPS